MTIHFSPLGQRGICGTSGDARYTTHAELIETNPDACKRCRLLVRDQNATGADLWALEAVQRLEGGSRHLVPTVQDIQNLYALAVKKRFAETQKAQAHLEYEQAQLHSTVMRAQEYGVTTGVVTGTVSIKKEV